jgi:hypothetical protein
VNLRRHLRPNGTSSAGFWLASIASNLKGLQHQARRCQKTASPGLLVVAGIGVPKHFMKLQTLVVLAVACFFVSGAGAQSLQFVNANYPGIYCRFNPNCNVSPTEQSDSFTPTNVAATCVLMSRSFPGTSTDSSGRYGYEYQLTINNNGQTTDTNIVTVNSLTLAFGAPDYFAFAEHASNQVWVVMAGGPVGLAPGSASTDGKQVTVSFDPPLTLQTQSDQTTNTLVFGMMSDGAPETTTAILTGSAQDPVGGTISFKAKLQAQTP